MELEEEEEEEEDEEEEGEEESGDDDDEDDDDERAEELLEVVAELKAEIADASCPGERRADAEAEIEEALKQLAMLRLYAKLEDERDQLEKSLDALGTAKVHKRRRNELKARIDEIDARLEEIEEEGMS